MLMNEIASAEDTLELYKLINDSVWAALQKQQTEENERKAAARRAATAKRSSRKPKRTAKAFGPVAAPPPPPASSKPIAATAASMQPTTAAISAANATARSNAGYAAADADDVEDDETAELQTANAAASTQRQKALPA